LIMKREEQIANTFLKEYFGKLPIYEPLGKSVPPDFGIGTTAFEVRRLNQQFFSEDGTAEGLEQVEFKLMKAIRGELAKIPLSPAVGSYFGGVHYERPLNAGVGEIAREVAKEAFAHYSIGPKATKVITSHGVTVQLGPLNNSYRSAFISGYQIDEDSDGMFSEIYLDSIEVALEDKINKTQNIKAQFSNWVLVLVDFILPETLWTAEVGPITLNMGHFKSVVVINPDGTVAMEWPDSSLRSSLRP
jgi:hypothetical protein